MSKTNTLTYLATAHPRLVVRPGPVASRRMVAGARPRPWWRAGRQHQLDLPRVVAAHGDHGDVARRAPPTFPETCHFLKEVFEKNLEFKFQIVAKVQTPKVIQYSLPSSEIFNGGQ